EVMLSQPLLLAVQQGCGVWGQDGPGVHGAKRRLLRGLGLGGLCLDRLRLLPGRHDEGRQGNDRRKQRQHYSATNESAHLTSLSRTGPANRKKRAQARGCCAGGQERWPTASRRLSRVVDEGKPWPVSRPGKTDTSTIMGGLRLPGRPR